MSAFSVSYLVLWWRRYRGDPVFLPLVIVIVSLGLAEVYHVRPDLARRQLVWAVLGIGVLTVLGISRFHRALERHRYLCASLGLILLALTLVLGVERGGARSWLVIWGMSLQASEPAKILLVAFLSSYLGDSQRLLSLARRRVAGLRVPDLRYAGPLLLMWALFMAMLVFQKDLGAALLFFGVFLFMLYAAGTGRTYVLSGVAMGLCGAALAYWVYPHVRVRVDTWLNPWQDPEGSGYQIVQSLFALASGGILGRGLGAGLSSHLPVSHADFIFAVMAEDLGLVGALAVGVLYFTLVARFFSAALRAGDEFSKLFCAGLASAFGLQTLLIVAGVTKLAPLTGVTLPLASYGGSSMLVSFIMVGFVMGMTHNERPEPGSQ